MQELHFSTHEVVDNNYALSTWINLDLLFTEDSYGTGTLSFDVENISEDPQEYIKVTVTTYYEYGTGIDLIAPEVGYVAPNTDYGTTSENTETFTITFQVDTGK